MDGKERHDGTDNAPLRPVSSLLSHFEHLSSRQPSSTPNTPRDSAPRLLKPQETESSQYATRASLDLPRSRSPWGATDNAPSKAASNGRPVGTSRSLSPGPPRYGRPLSLNISAASHALPSLTVDSPAPRPPSRSSTAASAGGHWSSLTRDASDIAPKSASWQSPPRPFRATTPTPAHERSGQVSQPLREPSPVGKAKSVPPPVNRAEKPKIPPKPSNIPHLDGGSLAPALERTQAGDRVSPFSTPPSSPERSPAAKKELVRPSRPSTLQLPSRRTPEPLPLSSSLPPTSRPPPPAPRSVDAREPGFSRPRPVPVQSKEETGQVSRLRDAIEAAAPGQKPAEDTPDVRPALPPRDGGRGRPAAAIGVPEPRDQGVPSRTSVDIPSRQTKPTPSNRLSSIESPSQLAPPPPRPAAVVSGKSPSATAQSTITPRPPATQHDNRIPGSMQQPSYRATDDSDVEEAPEPAQVPRTDYPDSTQVNRRPPVFRDGPREIPTRYDTRDFDICGRHVCTTGYLTRVWDLTTGEQLMSLSHGETVKVLSLAFKPGKSLEDEGTRLWLGTTLGELHEVDIPTQSIVASRSYPSRREVIKIYRHKKEMWTLDDEGRLFVWPPDETGTPNLQYSYHTPYDRVLAKGHTFSMVVGDDLWLATGKEVRVYRPNARDESFYAVRRPIVVNHSGDVTSGSHTTKHGGRVYLGYSDGRVAVYSSSDYTCLASVNVSVYKITSLAMVGDYLWAAYNTGMIYVYDISTNPWTVKKDWNAHASPVAGLIQDHSSLWTLNRLQVVSLGTDNYLRLWDGMLEDDWLEARMQSRDVEYCTFREIRAAIVTWNAGASVPRDVQNSTFIRDAIHPEQPPEILVFGFQELVDLEDKKITAKSLLRGSKKKDNHDKEHMSRQYRVWRDHLAACINEAMPVEESYVLLHTANMVGLFTCVFIKEKERQRVRNIGSAEIKRGMGGLHGNKGALILRFVLDDSSLCFINCHLAAGQTQTANRNNDIAAILESESLPAENSLTARTDLFVNGGDGTMILDHEICILNGDLNYRIDSMPRNVVIEAVRQNNLQKLLERDQLLASKRKNPSFRLRSFNEAPITFAPTYKYDVGSDEYDSSEKKRSPAWCDRVLYRGVGRIKQLEYRRHEVRASDHRPVSASFVMRIKTILPKERAAVWESCQKEFSKEKRRLAYDTSVEYLVNVLSMDRDAAQKLIASGGRR
ncbi:hypothetical protein VTN31DRAFT_5121 [Thermomyces dupontii]|uniref:uncharacterized protein n=1 Tax=Talaromyces thermophilus TaxID=28565 RepID=UPI003742E02B